jgi:hypothetical protein
MPVLFGHHAVTTDFSGSEWMIITGGFRSHQSPSVARQDAKFHVWLLNLTHADLHGEERWLLMNEDIGNSSNSSRECHAFYFNATADPWKRADLWDHGVPCSPSPRQGHLSAVINDYLYVFQGYGESHEDEQQDMHVYRIPLKDVFANKWSSWLRIQPREKLDSQKTSLAPIKGGLWYQRNNQKELPRLVAYANKQCTGNADIFLSYVWIYDFTEDSWEQLYEINDVDFSHGDYSAIIIRNHLFLVGTDGFCDSPRLFWLHLVTKEVGFAFESQLSIIPNQTLVAYEDAFSKESILVGFGPSSFDRLLGTNLAVAHIQYNDDESIEVDPIDFRPPNKSPSDRNGHTAVLSAGGFMYIFGGYHLPTDVESVWQINVGAKNDCRLQVDSSYFGDFPWAAVDDFVWETYSNYDDETQDDDDDGNNFVFFIFLVTQFLLCFVPNRSNRRRGGSGQRRGGLTPNELNALPERIICNGETDEGVVCSICLLQFANGDEVRDLPTCKHFFHKGCLDHWLQSDSTCPLCRMSCRHLVSDPSQPSVLSRLTQWVGPVERGEPMRPTNEDGDVEMGSVYSLELGVEGGDGDDVSVLSSTSNGAASHLPSNSANPRGIHSGFRRGESSEPLAPNRQISAIT